VSVCSYAPLDGFFSVFKWVLPVYGALHFIPILFKWKNFLKDPGSVIVRAGLGSMRSSAFMGFLVVTNQSNVISLHFNLSLPLSFFGCQHYSVINTSYIDISVESSWVLCQLI